MTESLYLELLKRVLIDQIHHPSAARLDGTDWPEFGFTMIGLQRLNNIEYCADSILRDAIPGDFLEAGVWKGGASIFMRALLKDRQVADRTVWLADSFMGLPPPKPEYPLDAGDTHYQQEALAIDEATVRQNFERFYLLDEQVRFLPGWFHETLAVAPVEQIALLRLDGDMYESTIVSLEALYDRVSVGGYIIIDDYGYIESCRSAVHDFLHARSLQPSIRPIDWTGVFWRKEA